jgi:hypothetical protein
MWGAQVLVFFSAGFALLTTRGISFLHPFSLLFRRNFLLNESRRTFLSVAFLISSSRRALWLKGADSRTLNSLLLFTYLLMIKWARWQCMGKVLLLVLAVLVLKNVDGGWYRNWRFHTTVVVYKVGSRWRVCRINRSNRSKSIEILHL